MKKKKKPTPNPLQTLYYPNSEIALLQQLQTLVTHGNEWWIGGTISPNKFGAFVKKMADTYPLLRTPHGRVYDRKIGKATCHFVAWPTPSGIQWWILSSSGAGGLTDPTAPDLKVVKNVMARDGHIESGDYVLLYAHKKHTVSFRDGASEKEVEFVSDISTWTWRLRSAVYAEVLANIEEEVRRVNFGDDGAKPFGLKGLLHFQRQRPLFGGVRAQVIELHREADKRWGRVRGQWKTKHPTLVDRYGEKAGMLRPLREVTSRLLPKMTRRVKVYGDPTRILRVLCEGDE